ncbi:uncharacterized protein LOC130446007 [Diorhabda sublineata]|uniref:uncharacterized protein LOC130446007 n=1 Tax=Diorhabda sublineata TaxID=1163346 RepID=UPI0024E07257|nr:uncharacterized protein LOC130446007 [Diorhabda sublineata]
MARKKEIEEINTILKELEQFHLSAGPLYQKVNSCKALLNPENNELDVIYNLMESHSPGLRNKTVYRYEKLLADESNPFQKSNQLELSKERLTIKCSTYPKEKKIQEMLNQIDEFPKEWTVVQLTPQYNPMEIWNEDPDVYYTNAINISMFTSKKPFLVTCGAPRDPVNGDGIELCNEIISILKVNKEVLTSHSKKMFSNYKEKNDYMHKVQGVEDRLKLLIKDMQKMWLKEWRCLLTGKYCDEKIESQIRDDVINSLKSELPELNITQKIETILCCVVKNYLHLKLNEVKNIVQFCFPEIKDKIKIRTIVKVIRGIGQNVFIENEKAKRHPVILILHDSLDCFPWEMLDVLEDHPACRLPSLHFLYCLFKEHENDIVDGYKLVKDYNKGAYVVNPTMDLKNMETRMMSFFNYWTPNWIGSSGYQPSKDEFFELLTSCDIFSYNGHGSGSHYLPMDKFQKSHVKAVVMLFGCGSTKIVRTDPQADMFGHYYMYLIARCPCVVGMLWEVADKSTDVLSTDFMSFWIPSDAAKHWKYIDKQQWQRGGETVFSKNLPIFDDDNTWEPDLLRALILAKKNLPSIMTKAACVVRGLPVKINKF